MINNSGKNKLNLKLPQESSDCSVTASGIDLSVLQKSLEDLDLDDEQRKRLELFLIEKQKVGELNWEDFEALSELASGDGTLVSKVLHKPSGLIMARKQIRLEVKPAIHKQIIRELKILHECNSPHLVGFYGAFYSDGEISICLEYMDGGSLDGIFKKTDPIPEVVLGKIVISVLRAFCYLKEKQQVFLKDIKPSNILLNSQGEIKICDFCEFTDGPNIIALFQHLNSIINEPQPSATAQAFSAQFQDFIDRCLKTKPAEQEDWKSLTEHPFVKLTDEQDVDLAAWVCTTVGLQTPA